MAEAVERDNATREATLNRLREALGDDVGGAQADTFEGQLDTVETMYDRDRDRPHRQLVKKDEFDKVHEINGEYLDTKLEGYLDQSMNAEQEYQEKKYGRGPLGRAKRFAKETFWGQALTFGAKMTGGILCHVATHTINVATAGAGSPLTPLFIGLGNQLMVDAVAGAAQFGLFERGRIQQLRESRTQRVNSVLRAMQIRNAINRPDDNTHDIMGSLNVDGSGEVNLRDELNGIISNLDTVEGNIVEQEQDLARIRSVGTGVRALLGLGVTGASLYHAVAHGGIGLGIHDFDGNGTPHKVLLNMANFLGFERAPGVVGSLGGVAPWAAVAGIGAATVGALGFNVGMNVAESAKQRCLEQNPKNAAVFSLRGRTELGNAQNELSLLKPVTPGSTEDRVSAIREAKAGMEQAGSIWRWDLNGTEETFITKGFNAEGGLKYVLIDPSTGAEGNAMIYAGDAVDAPFSTAKKLGNSVEDYKNNMKVDDTVKKVAEERGVGLPERGQLWVPGSAFDLRIGTNTVSITLENRIKIYDVKNNSKEMYIQVLDAADALVANGEGWVNTEDIIRKSKAPEKKEKKEGKEDHKEQLKEIESIFDKRGVRPLFEPKCLVRMHKDWYNIATINSERGFLTAIKIAGAGADLPDPVVWSGRQPDVINFEDFIASMNEQNPENRTELVELDIKPAPTAPAGRGGSGGAPRPR